VKTAFLNGVLKTPVYVEQPTRFDEGDRTRKVWKLKKALYGLVEAPRLWYETLNRALEEYGMHRLTGDPCVYFLREESHVVILGVFVDDFLVFGTSLEMVKRIKTMLGTRFKTKDLGLARWVLGMRLRQDENAYLLDQQQYLKDVLDKFDSYIEVFRKRLPYVPLPAKLDLQLEKDTSKVVDLPYREILGSVGHLAIGTRIDIAFAVSLLARFASAPTQEQFNALVHVLRYLKNCPDECLIFPTGKHITEFDANLLNQHDVTQPQAATDADFGGDPMERRSVGGMIVTMFGTAVSWRSKLQRLVATSTCHAEYMAAFEGAREIVWLRMFLAELGFVLKNPSILYQDNAAAKITAESVGVSDANKHIEVKFHYVRECAKTQQLRVETIGSKENPADALTKASTKESLSVMKAKSGIQSASGD
jgi:Reverse transcriptase (RNA-dependent DNA polymerase)